MIFLKVEKPSHIQRKTPTRQMSILRTPVIVLFIMKPATILLALASVLVAACTSPKISQREVAVSEPPAVALLGAAQEAHGGKKFQQVRDLNVRYDGSWGAIGPRFQPVLVDSGFRKSSEEHLSTADRTITQNHTGPKGKKFVLRERNSVTVEYNGEPTEDPETLKAAALVADAYILFLMGPFYFDRPGVTLATGGQAKVDGALCDELLAVIRPGFGMAKEDRVVMFIDRNTRQLRRVRFTLNGLESTQGAEVDVTFRGYRDIGGILWPTEFDERIRVPFDLHAHRWTMESLVINRGTKSAAGF